MKFLLAAFAISMAFAQTWVPQESGTTASLRGVSAVSATVAWASGSQGTFLRTIDGEHWAAGKVTGAADLDFRAIRAFDEKTAFALSIGSGEKSRIYRTSDGGATWSLVYTNPDPKGFYDALSFWDDSHGIVLGDPVDGHFVIMTTADGGASWHAQKTPAALPKEGAFAASNSCLFVRGAREVWFGTGGPGGARVFHSDDAGATWTVAKTPIRNDGASAGIFSIYFSDPKRGIAVGGDYNKTTDTTGTIAETVDGGKSWTVAGGPLNGFRSAILRVDALKAWMATGTSGSDISADAKSWKQFDSGNYNAISFSGATGFAVGPKGAVAKIKIE
jgi:photosystem II stability/assembly factor-like uncharacterized protein